MSAGDRMGHPYRKPGSAPAACVMRRTPWWANYLFGWLRPYRRWTGGIWEKRWISPPVASTGWYQRAPDEEPPPFSLLDATEDYTQPGGPVFASYEPAEEVRRG